MSPLLYANNLQTLTMGNDTLRLLFLAATNVSDFEKIANIMFSLKLAVFLNM